MKRVLIFICAFISCIEINAQIITTIVGNGIEGSLGDGGSATLANLGLPTAVAIDSNGNIYLVDQNGLKIRKVNISGIISTIAGKDTAGYRGDDSLASGAVFCAANFIKIGNDGNLYIPDICNNRIRKIDFTTDIITSIAGNGTLGFNEDGILATNAQVSYPFGIAFDNTGILYFGDGSNWVNKINFGDTIIRVAGSDSVGGYGGDGGSATDAILNIPVDVVIDLYGNLYISDLNNAVIRKIDAEGIITTYAGDTVWNYSGDGGPATLAQLNGPEGIAVDGAGNVYFADFDNMRVRRIDHETGIITTVAGNGIEGYSGDDSLATNAKLNGPDGIAFDAEGNLYIADYYNNRIRKVTNAGVPLKESEVRRAESGEISVYPNPAKNQITIDGAVGSEVGVYDIIGQSFINIILQKNNEVVDVSGLPKGVYFVEIVNAETGAKVVKKILKE